jgi:di/tripeptidase
MFISVDGPGEGNDLVTGAVASKRYRIVFHGPGGHSYGAYGIVNPAYALAKAVDRISKLQTPINPRTTINVGVIGGGTSVNSIPHESWMEVDLRSESAAELEKLSDALLKQTRNAVDEENSVRSTGQGRITLEVQAIGERPAGQTRVESVIVQTASAVIKSFGMQPRYSTGSTDSNIPMSLKIPAITMDSGGTGGRAHALDEWIEVDKSTSVRGIQVVMTTLVALAGLQ